MSEVKFQLKGWHALIAIPIIIIVVIIRLATFDDLSTNEALMNDLRLRLTSEYFPDDVEKLKEVMKTGSKDEISKVANSITSTKLNFESIKGSSPLLSFSSNQNVIVKVTYSVTDDTTTRDKATVYYYYKHGSVVNTWQYQNYSNSIGYYLNFF